MIIIISKLNAKIKGDQIKEKRLRELQIGRN